jgi:hypothetical protein
MLRDALILLALLDAVVTVRVLRSSGYSLRQKVWQAVIVWFLPLLGAIVVWSFADSDRGIAKPARASEGPPDRSGELSQVTRGHGDSGQRP